MTICVVHMPDDFTINIPASGSRVQHGSEIATAACKYIATWLGCWLRTVFSDSTGKSVYVTALAGRGCADAATAEFVYCQGEPAASVQSKFALRLFGAKSATCFPTITKTLRVHPAICPMLDFHAGSPVLHAVPVLPSLQGARVKRTEFMSRGLPFVMLTERLFSGRELKV